MDKKMNEQIVNLLSNLIRINKDRIITYENATEELALHQRIRPIFIKRALESRILHRELSEAIVRFGGTLEKQSSNRETSSTWTSLKMKLNGDRPQSVFELCELNDRMALKAYDHALTEEINWPEDILAMLNHHRYIVKNAHEVQMRYINELNKTSLVNS